MRICMLSLADASQPYGSLTRPHFLGRHLARLGHDVLHIAWNPPVSTESGYTCVATRELGGAPHRERLRRLYAMASAFRPDLLYTHQRESGVTGLVLAPLLRVPHVYDAHTSMAWELPTYRHVSRLGRAWRLHTERLVLRRADAVVAPSPELRDFFVAAHRLDPDRVALVKNGVEADRYRPGPPDPRLGARWGIRTGDPVVGFTNPRIATFPTNDMALDQLFRALPLITPRVPEARFLVFGGGATPPAPSPRLVYTGYVDDLPAHLNLTDVCIAPFPAEAVCGGTRNKVCEYLACGKAVVASREAMRGFDDARPGEHYVRADGTDDFAAAVVATLADAAVRERLGKSARTLAERYDWAVLARTLGGVLEAAVRARPRHRAARA